MGKRSNNKKSQWGVTVQGEWEESLYLIKRMIKEKKGEDRFGGWFHDYSKISHKNNRKREEYGQKNKRGKGGRGSSARGQRDILLTWSARICEYTRERIIRGGNRPQIKEE